MSRILIVDDVADTATVFTLALHNAGHETHSVLNGFDAVAEHRRALMAHRPFDLIIMDLAMSGMTGFEAADRIRQLEPEAPIVYLTAYDEPMTAGRAAITDTTIWNKPMAPTDLVMKVAELLAERRRS